MRILCIDNLNKTFYSNEIHKETFYDTTEAFKIVGVEVLKYSIQLKKTLIEDGYEEVI